MDAVQRHCDRAILLEGGMVAASGEPADVTSRYLEVNFADQVASRGPEDIIIGDQALARFGDVRVNGAAPGSTGSAEQGKPIVIEADVEIVRDLERPAIGFQIVRDDNYMVFAQMAYPQGNHLSAGDRVTLRAEVENELASGHYFVHAAIGFKEVGRLAAFRKNAAGFIVFGGGGFGGIVKLRHEITLTKDGAEITDRGRPPVLNIRRNRS
jgi:hypothetical protein